VLQKEDNIVCIDLDNCIGDDGKICDKANYIVRIMNSWTEISQSGKGLHIFIRGSKPTDKSKATPDEFKSLEVYDSARYIALTGNHLPGTPLTIEDRQSALNTICDLYFPKSESTPPQTIKPHHDSLTDDEIIALCRKAQNAPKFVSLYDNGDTSLYNGDESRADEALACMLAFYTKDAAQLERLMNASALARREKWRQREDYRRRTIQKALSLTREHYDAKPKSTMNLDSHSPTRLKVKLDFDPCPKCDSSTLDIFMQDGMYFLKCLRCDFSKPVIEFRDNLDEGKLEFKCPKCGLWQEQHAHTL
jgi:putative DNA primase/helicase